MAYKDHLVFFRQSSVIPDCVNASLSRDLMNLRDLVYRHSYIPSDYCICVSDNFFLS